MTILEQRRLWRLWRASTCGVLIRLLLVSARGSVTRQAVTRSRQALAASGTEMVVRVAGYAVLSAALAHGALLRVLPSGTVGSIPIATTIGVALAGVGAAVFARPAAAAWPQSTTQRWWSDLMRDSSRYNARSDAPQISRSSMRVTM